MTWGGTNFFFIKIVTIETGDTPKGVFWCFLDPLESGNRTTMSKKSFENMIKSCTWGVVK
jgi:hypothetical protein